MPTIDRSYEPFAKEPEYVELNRCFVRSVLSQVADADPRVIVDVACGVGTLSLLLAEELQRPGGSRLRILGVDLSRESLSFAREALASAGCPVQAALVEGSGDRLAVRSGVADAVLIGNAIHLFVDKPRLVGEVARVLRPGGVFGFNTGFYEGARSEACERFSEEWTRQALRHAKQRARRTAAGRNGGAAAFTNAWLLPREYRQLLEAAGFRVSRLTERSVEMSRSNFEAIGAYAEFASMQLRGYPLEVATEALVSTVAPVMRNLGMSTVSRSWLELIAVKQ
jgi:ubiquinone/menaquinone biosynthesis C-methylase UbiE